MTNEKAIVKPVPAINSEDGHTTAPRKPRQGQGLNRGRARTADRTASRQSGLEGDHGGEGQQQDTPGRHKSASSRQQTQPGQATKPGH